MRDEKLYFAHKRQELMLLNSYLENAVELPDIICCTHQIVDLKYQIKQAMQIQVLKESIGFSETSFNDERVQSFASHKLWSSYQRYDLSVSQDNMLRDLYLIEDSSFNSNGLYTTCGMAAILAVLHGAKSEFETLDIVIPSDSYFETIYYIEKFLPESRFSYEKFSKNSNFKILWYDTLSNKCFFELARSLNQNPDIVVIDTTLYELGSSKLKAILAWLDENKIPSFLVRSHIKLDSLACEYGRLGSLVLLLQKEYPSHKLEMVMKLAIKVKDFVSRSGTNFFPLSLFPLQNSNDFHDLNLRRIDQIRMNSAFVTNSLKECFKKNSNVTVFNYQHKLFITVELSSLTDRKSSEQKVKKLVSILNDNNVMARFAGSFAFDFMALDSFKDYVTGKERIRISFSDQNRGCIEKAVKVIISYIKKEVSLEV